MRDAVMLLYDYLDVLNAALIRNPDDELVRSLQQMGETVLDDGRLGVRVVPDDERFAIRFNGKSFAMMPDDPPAPEAWRAPRAYLERVVGDPAAYIERPETLEWDWLRTAAAERTQPPSTP
jgi:hypothetical protein